MMSKVAHLVFIFLSCACLPSLASNNLGNIMETEVKLKISNSRGTSMDTEETSKTNYNMDTSIKIAENTKNIHNDLVYHLVDTRAQSFPKHQH